MCTVRVILRLSTPLSGFGFAAHTAYSEESGGKSGTQIQQPEKFTRPLLKASPKHAFPAGVI